MHFARSMLAAFCIAALLCIAAAGPKSAAGGPRKTCDEQMLETDACMRRAILVGNKEASIPRTVQQLDDQHCKRVRGELLCAKRYGQRCLKLFTKTIFNIARGNIERLFRTVCKSQRGKEEAVKHFQCFKPENLPTLHALSDRLTLYLDHVATSVSTPDIIPYLCCAYQKFSVEGLKIIDDMCRDVTGKETSAFLMRLIKSAVSDAMDLGCAKYSSVDKCSANLPGAIEAYAKLLNVQNVSVPRNYTGFVPLMAIAKRLENNF